jgi:hypothetical protein
MKRATYISHARKVKFVGGLMFILVGGTLAAGSFWLHEQAGNWGDAIQDHLRRQGHPDLADLVSVLPLVLLFAVPILVPLVLLYLLDSRIGLPCPRCGRSLTLHCNDRVVARTGRCELCHQSIFDQEDETAESSARGSADPPGGSA